MSSAILMSHIPLLVRRMNYIVLSCVDIEVWLEIILRTQGRKKKGCFQFMIAWKNKRRTKNRARFDSTNIT